MYFLFYAILELKPDDILNFKILLSLGQVDQNKVCFEFILFSVLLEWKRVCVWGGGGTILQRCLRMSYSSKIWPALHDAPLFPILEKSSNGENSYL